MTWTIDKAHGVARLDATDIQPGGIELPLEPMLGCVGVAPERKQAIATSYPGNFGGNMGFTERGAQTFMGQAAELEIANDVDPNFTVVTKIPKSMLSRH